MNIELDLDERDVDLIGTLIAEHHFKSKSAVAQYAIGLLRPRSTTTATPS